MSGLHLGSDEASGVGWGGARGAKRLGAGGAGEGAKQPNSVGGAKVTKFFSTPPPGHHVGSKMFFE